MSNLKYHCCAAVPLLIGLGLCQPTFADDADISHMSWLIGMWVSEPNEAGTIHEYVYEPLFNGELISTQMEVNKGKTTHYEVRTIREQDGKVTFLGQAFRGDMSPAPYPARAFESEDAKQVNFTDMKLIRTGKNSMTLEFTTHPKDGGAKTTDVELKRTMAFVPVKP